MSCETVQFGIQSNVSGCTMEMKAACFRIKQKVAKAPELLRAP